MKAFARQVIRRIVESDALAPLGRPAFAAAHFALQNRGFLVVPGFDADRRAALQLLERVRADGGLAMTLHEAYVLYETVRRVDKVPGALAEVGVFRGRSARIIGEARREGRQGEKALHLFDTFEGLPPPGQHDQSGLTAGQYFGGLDEVRRYLSSYPDVHFHKGRFPGTAGPVADERFAFVNLDVDLYESTRGALEFFYPRLSPSGVILSHDYTSASGVRRAFDEFFADKPEPVLLVGSSQCLVAKQGPPARP